VAIAGLVAVIAFCFTMIRFWYTPQRKIKATDNEIVSPADGNVIYINQVLKGEAPVSIKGNTNSKLEELTKTDILGNPCWLIGINMTPFDVHKNCAPIDGEIILNQHFSGKFLSLKNKYAIVENERNTYVIQNRLIKVGVIQIASKLVRRIDTYVRQGDQVQKGNWLGMIRFGSQVDVVIPGDCRIIINVGQQVYAGTTIIASIN
jgi:phosphatidylserine decarboxylase